MLIPWGQGSDAGLSLLPSNFVLCFFRSGHAGSGRVVAEAGLVRTLQKKKKRPPTWEGNVSGSMASGTYTAVRETQEDATGFACLRGQDRTDLDRKKKKPSMGVFSTGQDTK